jgi:hypothetical protein
MIKEQLHYVAGQKMQPEFIDMLGGVEVTEALFLMKYTSAVKMLGDLGQLQGYVYLIELG